MQIWLVVWILGFVGVDGKGTMLRCSVLAHEGLKAVLFFLRLRYVGRAGGLEQKCFRSHDA